MCDAGLPSRAGDSQRNPAATGAYRDMIALEGYERLIVLAMIGDRSLFTRSDGIERLWEISAQLLDNPPPVEPYARGSWGPKSVSKLIAPYRWHLPPGQGLAQEGGQRGARLGWQG